MAFVALATVAATAACGSGGTRWADLRGPGGDRRIVYERLVRFFHQNYRSPSNTPTPAAWCLAVGRNSLQALRLANRERVEPWLPSPRLLGAVEDLRPRVYPISDCVALQGDREVLRTRQLPAVTLVLSEPRWQGDYARVDAVLRESVQVVTRFGCRMGRTLEGWEVMECL